MNTGDRINISGPVNYGDHIVRVVSNGTVVSSTKKSVLVTIDYIDGDRNATVEIPRRIVKPLS